MAERDRNFIPAGAPMRGQSVGLTLPESPKDGLRLVPGGGADPPAIEGTQLGQLGDQAGGGDGAARSEIVLPAISFDVGWECKFERPWSLDLYMGPGTADPMRVGPTRPAQRGPFSLSLACPLSDLQLDSRDCAQGQAKSCC